MRTAVRRVAVVLGVLFGAVLVPASTASASVGSLLATLKDPGGLSGDGFGHAVAISGNTAIVGAPCFGCSGAPAAYIYVKGTSGWPSSPTVTLANPSTGPDFGISVAISGKTAVVGQGIPTGGFGAAYIYTKTKLGWPTTPTKTLPDPSSGTGFGLSVAVSGKTVLVGAPCPVCGCCPGSAYLYVHRRSGWPASPTKALGDPAAATGDAFGASVQLSKKIAVIGAPGTTGGGAAYLYVKGATGWSSKPTVSLSDPLATSGDGFGSVGISTTKTNLSTVIVGADGTGGAGAAYMYVKTKTGWPTTPNTSLSDPAATSGDAFGSSVAVSGTAGLVGAWGTSVYGMYQGATYVYVYGISGWPATATVSIRDPAATSAPPPSTDEFGFSVAVSGPTAIVGADATGGVGAAYIYQT